MQRILVDLPEETIKDLEELARKKSISRAEIIRIATDTLIKSEKSVASAKAFSGAFGIWKKNPMTDEELRSLRDEWNQP